MLGLGPGFTNALVLAPTPIVGDFVAAACNGLTTIFLTASGDVYWAGYNGAAADGSGIPAVPTDHPTPQRVANIGNIVRIAAASGNLYALDSTKQLWVWGSGLGFTGGNAIPTVIHSNVVDFAFGLSGIILLGDGTVWTTGSNTSGSLANGTTTSSTGVWINVTPAGSPVIGVAHGEDAAFNLVVRADGTVLGAGDGSDGQLGDAGYPNPVNASWLTLDFPAGVVQVWCGLQCSFAKLDTGAYYACGWSGEGRLGIGNTSASHPSPTPIIMAPRLLDISGSHTYTYTTNTVALDHFSGGVSSFGTMAALGADGYVYVWGNSDSGAQGTGFTELTTTFSPTAQQIPILSGMTWVGGGQGNVFAGSSTIVVARRGRSYGQLIG